MGPCVREYVVQAVVDWRPVEKLYKIKGSSK